MSVSDEGGSLAGDPTELVDEVVLDVDAIVHTVGYGLIQEAIKFNKITPAEGEYFIEKYRKLTSQVESSRAQEQAFSRKLALLESDILAEKITLEKTRMEEGAEMERVQRAGVERNALQRELDEVEQKDTMARFELLELRRLHEELQTSLINMRHENSDMVDPVLEKLRKDISELIEQMKHTEESYEREVAQKAAIEQKVKEVEGAIAEKKSILKSKSDALNVAKAEPGRLQRQISSISSAVDSVEAELLHVSKKLEQCKSEMEKQVKRKVEGEKTRTSILEKLELNRQTLEDRERDVAAIQMNLDKAKAQGHDLVTRKVELNSKFREAESTLRLVRELLSVAEKDYDGMQRTQKKKRGQLDSVKETLPGLENQLKDVNLEKKHILESKASKRKDIEKLRDEVDLHVARLLQQEGVQGDKKAELEQSIAELDEMEAKVVHWLAEGKRQAKLLSVLSAQRDIRARENARIESKEKEAKEQVRMKEMVILDLTKRCNELTNRLKEFSALYEVVKNERNKYVNLIQSSSQALAEMREKIRILQNEVEILGNERSAKDIAFTKEHNAHMQAQNQRDGLRQDLNRLLSEYRERQGTVEQQIQEIDKLNVAINSLEKEMLLLKSRYEHAVEQRNVTGVQLIDRNDELCILYERSNQQQEALRKGEIETVKKEEELRMLRIYTEMLKRKYLVAKKRVPEIGQSEDKIKKLEEQLQQERKLTEEYSAKLEDPQNLERWRPLEGEDPDMEQLLAKIKILEDRLDSKREQLLEKELVLEEITSLTEKLRTQAVNKRESAKVLGDELNDLHVKIREVTKKMLASVSELSMYQATALRLQQEKIQRDKALEEAEWRVQHGEPPSEQAEALLRRTERTKAMHAELSARRALELPLQGAPPGQFLRTAAEPRPTAYIPDELGIPKPYGNLAPFKPSEAGSTMRHIKVPQIKPIEI